jgi:hypothetical protein
VRCGCRCARGKSNARTILMISLAFSMAKNDEDR